MKKFAVTVLLLLVCAAPALAWPWHKKPPKDPRFAEHPKAYHPENPNLKHPVKHKIPKHKAQ
jgi:hypothetical protein